MVNGIIPIANGKEVVYSIPDLLNAVKNKPILWSIDLPGYGFQHKTIRTWIDISSMVCTEFNDLSQVDQHIVYQALKKCWINVRNEFIEANRAGKSSPYDDEMDFLLDAKTGKFKCPKCDSSSDDNSDDVPKKKKMTIREEIESPDYDMFESLKFVDDLTDDKKTMLYLGIKELMSDLPTTSNASSKFK